MKDRERRYVTVNIAEKREYRMSSITLLDVFDDGARKMCLAWTGSQSLGLHPVISESETHRLLEYLVAT